MESTEAHIPDALRWAALSFKVDRVTAEVTAAFNAASIESILLKGPAIATWLYRNDHPRLYSDSDLLVQRSDWAKAKAVVKSLGFKEIHETLVHPRMEPEEGMGYPGWKRSDDGTLVDLHYALFGLGAEPEEIWDLLSSSALREPVGGIHVQMPSHPARLVHIALHAVQHGGEDADPMVKLERRPMIDLERAVAKVPAETWVKARELAEQLDGAAAFAAGLSLTPDGRQLAVSIGAHPRTSIDIALRLGGVPLSEGFAELSEASGLRAKVALLVREAFPTPTFMRWWSPLARHGFAGLILAYGWRLAWLSYRVIPGFRAWRRAARSTR